MKRMVGFIFITLAILWPLTCQAFDSELHGGEGRVEFYAKVRTLALHGSPSTKSPIVEKRAVKIGQKIEYSQTRYRIVTPGKVKTIQSYSMNGMSFGKINLLTVDLYINSKSSWTSVPFTAGKEFEYLQEYGEGNCFIRMEQEIFELERCPWVNSLNPDSTYFEYLSEPVTEWWINLSKKGKKTGAWLKVSRETLKSNYDLP